MQLQDTKLSLQAIDSMEIGLLWVGLQPVGAWGEEGLLQLGSQQAEQLAVAAVLQQWLETGEGVARGGDSGIEAEEEFRLRMKVMIYISQPLHGSYRISS